MRLSSRERRALRKWRRRMRNGLLDGAPTGHVGGGQSAGRGQTPGHVPRLGDAGSKPAFGGFDSYPGCTGIGGFYS
jgi:hypothetical protein